MIIDFDTNILILDTDKYCLYQNHNHDNDKDNGNDNGNCNGNCYDYTIVGLINVVQSQCNRINIID